MSESLLDRAIYDELASLMGDAIGILKDKFEKQSADYVRAVLQAVEREDAHEVAQAAHPLKSSSKQLGLVALSDLAGQIEDEAKEQNSVTDSIRHAASSLESLYQESLKALHEA
ncbi:MAG: Hpt domain-containing protein [Rickettsiales bacterium]|nr:Hpt domain-containing protein [Rickettsiales bacterium]